MRCLATGAALFLACLAAGAAAKEPAPAPIEALDEVVVAEEHERQRQASPTRLVSDPDVVTLSRRNLVTATVQLHEPKSAILFRHESEARRLQSGAPATTQIQIDRITRTEDRKIQRATVEFTAGMDEHDGQPAVFQFGPHTSLIDLEYARLQNTGNSSLYLVKNAIDPETRRCVSQFGTGDGAPGPSKRFVFLADSMNECQRALQKREIDLLFVDDFPALLRQALLDVYEPAFSRLSHKLGSEPGQIFVAWRPDSQRNDFFFDSGWVRNGLLLFNGAALQSGLDTRQRDSLRELLVRVQLERRLFKQGANNLFIQSAVNYLTLLTTSGLKQATLRELSDQLPVWIVECARQRDTSPGDSAASKVLNRECGNLVQFVYDAAIRAKSNGKATVYDTWRQLLSAAFKRSETGVDLVAFVGSSPDGLRITRALLDGSMDWPTFATELGKLGVQLRITQDQPGISAQVLSLQYFRDEQQQ